MSEADELAALRAKVARYEAPGGWTELMQREAWRVLGNPCGSVMGSARLEPLALSTSHTERKT